MATRSQPPAVPAGPARTAPAGTGQGRDAPVRSRADAVRNQRLLLDAAGRAFARHGLQVSVSRIVRDAGLGKGTAFRCFATKDDLVAAVVAERLDEVAATARDLLARDDPDGLRELVTFAARLQAGDRGYAEALAQGTVAAHPDVRRAEEDVRTLTAAVLDRARRAGRVRDGVTAADVLTLQRGIGQAAAGSDDPAGQAERCLRLVLDALTVPARPSPA